MKKILFLAAFVLLGVTVTSCEMRIKGDEFANNESFITDDGDNPIKPVKPTFPPPPPPPTVKSSNF